MLARLSDGSVSSGPGRAIPSCSVGARPSSSRPPRSSTPTPACPRRSPGWPRARSVRSPRRPSPRRPGPRWPRPVPVPSSCGWSAVTRSPTTRSCARYWPRRAPRCPVDVVPAVTAAIGATTYAGVPVGGTHTVADVRGARASEIEALTSVPGTLVLTVEGQDASALGEQLVSAGLKPDTPIAVISRGTTTEQQTITGTVGEMGLAATGMSGPVVIAVGKAVAQREKLGWWESRPLYGWRVLVPRTKDQAGDMSAPAAQLRRGARRGADHRGRAAAHAHADGARGEGPGHRPLRVGRVHLDQRGARGLGQVRRVRPGRARVRRRQDRLRGRVDRRRGAQPRHPA